MQLMFFYYYLLFIDFDGLIERRNKIKSNERIYVHVECFNFQFNFII